MKKVHGNKTAVLQTYSGETNSIGESTGAWTDVARLTGWLDYQSGSAGRQQRSAMIEDSTHIWICDYDQAAAEADAETCRMSIDGRIYDVLLIDDPMGMHYHLEIYLKYVGGQ